MQSLRSLLVPALLTTWVCTAPCLTAQEPEPTPPAATQSVPPAAGEAEEGQPEQAPRGNRRGRRERQPLVVIEAGTIHPVGEPDIQNGVVVIRGDRILAVGKQGDLGLPADTVVHSFPTGHVYPGLIDAATDAFTDRAIQGDGSLNGGSTIAEGLVWVDDRDGQLSAAGITTAYVAPRSQARLRGQGAIVRPQRNGFELWPAREQAALELRMTDGPSPSHPLQRQQQLESTAQLFDGLDDYRDAKEKFAEELKKYETEFAAYLDFHKKKNAKEGEAGKEAAGDKKAEEAPATKEQGPTGPEAGRGGNGGGPPRREPPKDGAVDQPSPQQVEQALLTLMAALAEQAKAADGQDPRPQGRGERGRGSQGGPQGSPGAANGQGAPAAGEEKKDEGPKRPTYPKKPPEDPQKEALLRTLDGELPLRIEAHRGDELRAAMRLQREKEIPLLVLAAAYAAEEVLEDLAGQGATVVLTELLPGSLGDPSAQSNPYRGFDPATLPARLDAAGVPFAIASGRARLAPLLPLMAAAAIGRGLSSEAALRAITLTPAEILGIAGDTGSLARGKYADLIVTDGPLFATDSHVLMVVAKGRTEFEVQ